MQCYSFRNLYEIKFLINSSMFQVHRHHPPMIYGRDMIDIEPEESTGIALCKIEDSVLQVPCYAITTFQ